MKDSRPASSPCAALRALGTLYAMLCLAGCGEATQPESLCTAGETQACLGPGACQGAQVCVDDGTTWGPCDCGPGTGGAAGSGNGSAGSAGQSGNSGGSPSTGGEASASPYPPEDGVIRANALVGATVKAELHHDPASANCSAAEFSVTFCADGSCTVPEDSWPGAYTVRMSADSSGWFPPPGVYLWPNDDPGVEVLGCKEYCHSPTSFRLEVVERNLLTTGGFLKAYIRVPSWGGGDGLSPVELWIAGYCL
jgi:hypothetical protein